MDTVVEKSRSGKQAVGMTSSEAEIGQGGDLTVL
jgi:hypothetical protein